MKKTYLNISNVNIYCEYTLSEKPPIFLIHGFVSSTHTFHRLIPYLAKQFSIIAIDLPGFGRSEKSKTFIYSYSNYADLVIQCMDHFKLESVYMVGHSMGGQIALNTALKVPNRINKLVLLSSSGYLQPANKWLIFASYLPFFHLFAKRHIQKNGVRETLENVLYDHSFITKELIEEYKRPIDEKDFSRSLVRFVRYREGDLPSEQLKKIKIPSLLIWGTEDKVVSLRIGKRLAKDLAHTKLITYEKTGHLLTEERPTEIYEQITSFIHHEGN
ncbi:alpha/beta fold hydrolase [Ornithinibacillus salinisoli]|uniref:Alpha/beta fold hydrolase n=1 Tax=Ornithinibacillus salinisoli TaxID=1848459 RepID=A0ABW4W580_9BACI